MASWDKKLDMVMSAWEHQKKKEKAEQEKQKNAAENAIKVFKRQRDNTNHIDGVKNSTEVISSTPVNSVTFSRCEGSVFSIPDTCAKIVISACKRCTFIISGKVMTYLLELERCDQCTIAVFTELPTVQIDFCARLNILFATPKFFKYLFTTKSCGIYVATNPNEFENPRRIPLDVNDFEPEEDWRWHEVQYRTRLTVDGRLRTSPLQRDKQGYPLAHSPDPVQVGFNPGIVRTVPRMENDPLHPCNNIDGGGCSSSSSAAHPMDVDDGDDMEMSLEDMFEDKASKKADSCQKHSTAGGDPNANIDSLKTRAVVFTTGSVLASGPSNPDIAVGSASFSVENVGEEPAFAAGQGGNISSEHLNNLIQLSKTPPS